MGAGDAFGIAILVILTYWVTTGNLRRNGAGATLLRKKHPKRTLMLVVVVILTGLTVTEFMATGNVRAIWGALIVLMAYIALRDVELRDEGVFANPSFLSWDDIEWVSWVDGSLVIRSGRKFVSPRTLYLSIEDSEHDMVARIVKEKVGDRVKGEDG